VVASLIDSSLEGTVSVGDELVSVNGAPVGANPCSAQPWGVDGKRAVEVKLRRDGKVRSVTIEMRPVRTYLEARWLAQGLSLVNSVAYDESHLHPDPLFPYTFGLRVQKEGDEIRVVDVLRGGPADLAGIRLGDSMKVVSGSHEAAGGVDFEKGTLGRVRLELVVRGPRVGVRRLSLVSEPLTRVLSAPAESWGATQLALSR